VRALASRALAPLVPSKNLSSLLKRLLTTPPQSLPSNDPPSGSTSEPSNPPPASSSTGFDPDTRPPSSFSNNGGLVGETDSLPTSAVSTENFHQSCDTASDSSPKTPNLSSNAAHGSLLQASALLGSVRQWTDAPSRLSVLLEALPLVESRAWLGSLKRSCRSPLVAVAFLKLLDGLREAAMGLDGGVHERARTLLLELCSEAGQWERGGTSEGGGADGLERRVGLSVGLTDLREKAASLYFGCVLSQEGPLPGNADVGSSGPGGGSSRAEAGGVVAEVERALCDSSYEIRLAVLKCLKQSAAQGVNGRGVLTPLNTMLLQKVIVQRLPAEGHPKCLRRALRVLFLLSQAESNGATGPRTGPQSPEGAFGTSSTVELEALWATLLGVFSTARQGKSKEAALCCLGACLKHLLAERRRGSKQGLSAAQIASNNPDFNGLQTNRLGGENGVNGTGLREKVAGLLKLVKKHSRASESVTFRSAAADAIVASGLLKLAPEAAASLQPEKCARGSNGNTEMTEERIEGDNDWLVEAVLDAWFLSARLLEDEDDGLRDRLAESMTAEVATAQSPETSKPQTPSQVEQTLVRTLEYLTGLFGGRSESYVNRLAGWIYGPRGIHALAGIQGYDLVRRLFDKELDNHHEEDALFAQLASQHLRRILRGRTQCEFPTGKAAHSQSQASSPEIPQQAPSEGCSSHEVVKPRGPVGNAVALPEGEDGSAGPGTGPLAGVVWFWRGKFLARLETAVRGTQRLQKASAWVGGVTNHADAFALLYRALLGLLTFAPMKPDGSIGSGVSEVGHSVGHSEVGIADESYKDFSQMQNRIGQLSSSEAGMDIDARVGQIEQGREEELGEIQESLARAGEVLFGMALNPLVSAALLKTLAVYGVNLETVISDGKKREQLQQKHSEEYEPCFLMVAALYDTTRL
jgi:hypothetical protein